MNLEKKVRKLGLASLDDNKRYELAIDKSYWEHYKKYDYYKPYKQGNYFYSKEYLEKHSYRYLKHKWKEATFKTFRTRLDRWSFRLEVRLMKLKHTIRIMLVGD